jgi:hypothetical protein
MPTLFAVLFADVSQLKPNKEFELPVVSKSPASLPQIVFSVPLVKFEATEPPIRTFRMPVKAALAALSPITTTSVTAEVPP